MGMRPLLNFVKRYVLFLALLAAVVVVVGSAVYLSSSLSVNQGGIQVVGTAAPFASASPPDTPEVPLPPVDPAIIAYLQNGLPEYRAMPLAVSGANVPPIGAYLPRTGNTQYELPPTVIPPVATLPYPTSPPIPPTLPLPTIVVTPTLDLVATVLAFDAAVTPSAFSYSGSCAPSGLPVEGILTQYFTGYHSGIDLGAPLGTPVLATQSGIVTWADWNTFGYGNLVIIQSDHYITYYAHNTSFNVLLGQFVPKGALIAFSGSTGHSSGPHVHYETRIDDVPVDPLTFEARGFGTC
jgi:murein DD-endopeptidase MepM/ murein hydrolase activator NlpD